jgi:hydrogenase/urease accessory protein HupE
MQMKTLILMAGLFPVAAWAHPGHHHFESLLATLRHLLSEPDHVAVIAAALGLGLLWAGRLVAQRRRSRD